MIYIYDIEVFKKDWIVVFKNPDDESENEGFYVIHNNNAQLKEFVLRNNIMLGGFNNKHYDDWIIQSMLNGGTNEIIKKHNDFIINGGNGWEYPFIQFQKKYFKSFDLRDDLPIGLSLKAIEGNMGANIVETGVDFNIDRALTAEELETTIEYCKTDVLNTVKLYKARKKYLQSKMDVFKLKGWDEHDALCLTNAKLTAAFLKAKRHNYDDEFIYDIPECLKLKKYSFVLDFFKNPVNYTIKNLERQYIVQTTNIKKKSIKNKIEKIKNEGQYKTKLETLIAGIPHTFGWGGVHGADRNVVLYEDDEHVIVDIDVGSYYPSQMLVFDYISRSIPSKEGYKEVYETRLNAKHNGDSATAGALKLVLNTAYGAMKNKFNDLYDPKNANQICITGQLLLLDLIEKLETVKSFELIQSNTDGIILRYHKKDEKLIEEVVKEWENRTGLNMEYTVIHAYIAKDVNNYIIKAGATYLIDKDMQRHYTKEDKNTIETKGGYVSLYEGGDFKNNSLVIIHKAIVDYFVNHIKPEKTINDCTDILEFQIIAKTGGTYDGTCWECNGKKIEVQKVNRVYASNNKNYGTLYKIKKATETKPERIDKIANLPDNCVIDNENSLSINDIDKQFYIDLAYKRIKDYIGGNKMAETKITETKASATTKKAASKVASKIADNLYKKIMQIREEFIKAQPHKSGKNMFAGFKYFELADIVPLAIALCNQYGVYTKVSFNDKMATLTARNIDNPEEIEVYTSPMRPLNIVSNSGKNKMNELQGLGAEQTYLRRYLYMMFLDIVEADAVDAMSGSDDEDTIKKATTTKKAAANTKAKDEIIDKDGECTELQKKSIKRGLKALRDKDGEKYEPYIHETMKQLRAGMTKKEAEAKLIEIGEKKEA